MNVLNPIFGAICGGKLPVSEYDLGEGISLRATYAHVMAPFLMAFTPAEPGKPHPAPWVPVSGGLGFDAYIELRIDAAGNPEWLMGPQALWWVIALFRLKVSWSLFAPVFSDGSFHDMAKASSTRVIPLELTSRGRRNDGDAANISLDDLKWVATVWKRAAFLFHRERNFAQAFEAFDHSPTISSPSLGLLTLWSSLEHLFAPSKSELRFRVSALIASYLEPGGNERLELHKRVMKLYDQRSQAAHTANPVEAQAADDTYALMRRILLKIVDSNQVPKRDELEQLLFGVS